MSLRKFRKLPSLAAHLQLQGPVDNPALHQGRRRATPHVEGQWAAYVYIPLVISQRAKLFDLLLRIFVSAKQIVPSLHPIGFSVADTTVVSAHGDPAGDEPVELHISLTRPVYLRAHQRDDFKRAVREVSRTRRRCVFLVRCILRLQLIMLSTSSIDSLRRLPRSQS